MERRIPLQTNSPLANQLQSEQAALVDALTSNPDAQYPQLLQGMVEEKHEQVERLEWAIDEQIEQTEEALQRLHSSRPGLLSRSATKAQWEQSRQKLEQRLETLRVRHEHVREIADATSIHGTRLQELATQKLAHREPELVEAWEKAREEDRKERAAERAKKKQQQPEKRQGRAAGLTLGQSLE